jgi:hypothetical protein
VRAAGGRVVFKAGSHRVMGLLAMSRALGDHLLRPYVIADPEVTCFQRSGDDELLLLATVRGGGRGQLGVGPAALGLGGFADELTAAGSCVKAFMSPILSAFSSACCHPAARAARTGCGTC